jgi:hypothetical protein
MQQQLLQLLPMPGEFDVLGLPNEQYDSEFSLHCSISYTWFHIINQQKYKDIVIPLGVLATQT